MAPSPEDPKSCDPQLLTQPPDPSWGVEDLGLYARAQERAIVAGDRSLTMCYWRLGWALDLARKHFAHRQWGCFLEEQGIEKTRASKARAIHDTFAAEDEVAELTVQEAYRQRTRKPRATAARRSAPPPSDLMNFLLGICKQADFYAEEVGFAEPERAATVLTTIEEAIAELDKLRLLACSRLNP